MVNKTSSDDYGTCTCGRPATVRVREDISDNGRIWLGQDWYRDHLACDTCATQMIHEQGMGLVGADGSLMDASRRLLR